MGSGAGRGGQRGEGPVVAGAQLQDRDGAKPLLWALRACFPSIRLVYRPAQARPCRSGRRYWRQADRQAADRHERRTAHHHLLTWIQSITDGMPVTWAIEDGRGFARRLAEGLLPAGHGVQPCHATPPHPAWHGRTRARGTPPMYTFSAPPVMYLNRVILSHLGSVTRTFVVHSLRTRYRRLGRRAARRWSLRLAAVFLLQSLHRA